MSATYETLDEEAPKTEESITNRTELAKHLRIEKLLKRNKASHIQYSACDFVLLIKPLFICISDKSFTPLIFNIKLIIRIIFTVIYYYYCYYYYILARLGCRKSYLSCRAFLRIRHRGIYGWLLFLSPLINFIRF